VLKDLHQSNECLPVLVGTVMEQLLALGDFQFQLLHAPTVFLELLTIPPAVCWMGFQLSLKLLHRLHLAQNFPGKVVLRCGHVMALGHVAYSKSESTAVLIAMTKFSRASQFRSAHPLDLQTAQFGVQADHRLTGQQKPDVVVSEAQQERELTGAIAFVNDHGRGDTTAQLGRFETHQRADTGELQRQRELMSECFLRLLLEDSQQTSLLPETSAQLFILFKIFPGHITG